MDTGNEILTHYQRLLIQKRYSTHTVKTYAGYLRAFMNHFGAGRFPGFGQKEINDYIFTLVSNREISTSQQNQRINAIKFYYEKVLGREKQYYILHRPKKEIKQRFFCKKA